MKIYTIFLRYFIITLFICGQMLVLSCKKEKNKNEGIIDITNIDKYLQQYFNSKVYDVLDKIEIDNKSLTVAVNYINQEDKIIDNAIVIEKSDNKIIPQLYIEGTEILDGNRKLIIEVPMIPYKFYGWKLHYSSPFRGFTVEAYLNEGKNVGDSKIIEWNPKTKLFQLFDVNKIFNR